MIYQNNPIPLIFNFNLLINLFKLKLQLYTKNFIGFQRWFEGTLILNKINIKINKATDRRVPDLIVIVFVLR